MLSYWICTHIHACTCKPFILTRAKLLARIIVMMKVSKYLCWVILYAMHRHFHHIWPIFVFSTVVQHLHFLLNTAQKQSSGNSANSTSTSLISGSPSASTFFRLCVSLSSDTVEPSLSENVLLRSLSDARLGVLVDGSDNWKDRSFLTSIPKRLDNYSATNDAYHINCSKFQM